ncbi:hypothetical protein ZIOFF_045016 [Zingiber officinale]|uniref:F-box domain-containing protein n=1 Tax=Zingiber officinale TaxID=94328 RepID=A0A8J5G680_ZINOF|nr:hypothetical protein ZIOFF_045016 [Zingiber officinale]
MAVEAELIPGLPDCLALECLLRVPFHAILDARAVCKRWKHELDSPSFYHIRRAAGVTPRVVSLLLRGKLPPTVGKLHLALYEPDTGILTLRQLAPNRPNLGIRIRAMIIGRELVVIGGRDVVENRRTGEVHIYDLLSGSWRTGTPKPDPERLFCIYSLKGGKVFAVGGRDARGKKLQSALVYDVADDTWLEMSDLGQDICHWTSTNSSFNDKFWQNREEYINAIGHCKKLLLLDDHADLMIRVTEDEKEIVISLPKVKSGVKVMVEQVKLNEDVLGKLQRLLGLRPNEIDRHLEVYHFDRL